MPSSSSGNGCGHPGLCLTLTGPLAGTTSGLVQPPDCIPGGGIDVNFITHVGGHEASIEILVTDASTKDFHPGSFAIKFTRISGEAFASIYIRPDNDVAGFPGGWTTDSQGSSGTVVVNGDESGSIKNAVVAPAKGSGTAVVVNGSFNCR